MDPELVKRLIDRDWAPFATQARRLGLGTPTREDTTIELITSPIGNDERFRAVLECDGYDDQAPLLDFADPETGARGREYWPDMRRARELGVYNSISYRGRDLPILCTPGTRGYHLHPSHSAETHPKETWALAKQAALLHRLLHTWGPYEGRGL